MEGILPIIIVIVSMVVSLFKNARKEQEKQAAETRRRESAIRRLEARDMLQQRQQSLADEVAQAPAAVPVAPAVPGMPIAPAMPIASSAPAAPAVHVHLEPDCEVHDAVGSMAYVSTEGKDPCHEAQLTHPRPQADASQEAAGLTFDWSGESLVKAFVMQEILARPGQRRAQ